jgi:DNA polymerase-3 subunit delta
VAADVKQPPIIVIFGDEEHQKSVAVSHALDQLLPPEVDRSLALTTYDASEKPEQGGPTVAGVLEDLATLPFLADRRVVVVRDADKFVTAAREALERYLEKPAPTGVLVLEVRSFPKNTRLYKAAMAAGGEVHECRKLQGRALQEYAIAQAELRGKTLPPPVAARLIDLVGNDAGAVEAELEKLALYIDERREIRDEDVTDLVGLSREETIFRVADEAALGRLPQALRLWHHTLATDPGAPFRAVGGLAFVLRRWLDAHAALADGAAPGAVARKAGLWGRENQLQNLLRRQSAPRLQQALAALAHLDAQAKSGARSIEKGVELFLLRLAAPGR